MASGETHESLLHILEAVYLPDIPFIDPPQSTVDPQNSRPLQPRSAGPGATIMFLLTTFNQTQSSTARLILLERLSYYLGHRWMHLPAETFPIVLEFIRSVLNSLKLEHWRFDKTKEIVEAVVGVAAKLVVGWYGERTEAEDMVESARKMTTSAVSTDNLKDKDKMIVGLAILEGVINEFVSVKDSKFSKFKHNVSRFQTGRVTVYDILKDVLHLFEKVKTNEHSPEYYFNDPIILHKMFSITANGIKFNMMVNEDYSDFGEDVSTRGPVFVHGLQSKAGVSYLKKIPQLLPILTFYMGQKIPENIFPLIIDIFTSLSGYSMHFYKDKASQVKPLHTFNTIHKVVIMILSHDNYRPFLDKYSAEISLLVGNCVGDVMPGLSVEDEQSELKNVAKSVGSWMHRVVKDKSNFDIFVFGNIVKFWAKLLAVYKHKKSDDLVVEMSDQALKLCLEYYYNTIESLDQDSSEESIEILLRLGKQICQAFNVFVSTILSTLSFLVPKLSGSLPDKNTPSSSSSAVDSISTTVFLYYFSLFTSLTHSIPPSVVDPTRTSYSSQTLIQHSKLTSHTIDLLFRFLQYMPSVFSFGSSSSHRRPASPLQKDWDLIRTLTFHLLKNLLEEWVLNDKWELGLWVKGVCQGVGGEQLSSETGDDAASVLSRKRAVVEFIIKLGSAKEVVKGEEGFKGYLQLLECISSKI